jgi:hypothetical protein
LPHRRPRKRGSFGTHFDELVTQFAPAEAPRPDEQETLRRRAELRERVNIHAKLFERAWQLDAAKSENR